MYGGFAAPHQNTIKKGENHPYKRTCSSMFRRQIREAVTTRVRCGRTPWILCFSQNGLQRTGTPFGPAYHNLKEGVNLWEGMTTAKVYAPDHEGADGILGSPFPLDAAFHAACIWGSDTWGWWGFPWILAFDMCFRRLVGATPILP